MILEMTRPVQGGLRQERKLEAVSNHLANASTSGFKKDVVSFDKAFKARLNTDHAQGTVVETGNPLDVALGSEGFFKVETPEGIRYTRNGSFTLDAQGVLVDKNGNPILGQGGAIVIDGGFAQGTFAVNEEGQIEANGDIIDILDVVTFADRDKLKKQGNNLYEYTGDTTDEILPEIVLVKEKALEPSNVQVVDEMVRMIDYQRMFELYTKSMMTFDEVDAKAINDVGMFV